MNSRIDPNEPLYDGQARMSAAMAVLAAASQPQAVTRKQAPVAPASTSRRMRSFRRRNEPAPRMATRALRPDRRIAGGTRYYQPSTRFSDQFRSSASIPAARSSAMGSAQLMAYSRRVRPPVFSRAQELDRVRARAQAQLTVDTLRHRWNHVNRPDLSDGVPNAHHLRKSTRNYARDNKPNALAAAMLIFG